MMTFRPHAKQDAEVSEMDREEAQRKRYRILSRYGVAGSLALLMLSIWGLLIALFGLRETQ